MTAAAIHHVDAYKVGTSYRPHCTCGWKGPLCDTVVKAGRMSAAHVADMRREGATL